MIFKRTSSLWARTSAFADRHPWAAFGALAAILFIYQIPAMVCGLDMCDTGFYLTFFDNIFTRPGTVEYNFMYYASGLVGGLVRMALPGIGIVGMRVAGMLLVLAAAAAAFGALRRSVGTKATLAGLAVAIMCYAPAVLALNHDIISILLYTTSIGLMMRGLHSGSAALVAASGLAAGINVFVRTPNVVAVALAIVPALSALHGNGGAKRAAMMAAAFAGAMLAGMGLMVLLMLALGHFDLFCSNLRDLQSISADDDSSHNMASMIAVQLKFYAKALWALAKFGSVAAVWSLARRRIRQPLPQAAVLTVCLGAAVWIMARMPEVMPVWGMCVSGCAWTIATHSSTNLKTAAWLGLFMLLAFPLGSDNGAINNGSLIAMTAAPVAMNLWGRRPLAPFVAVLVVCCAARMIGGDLYFERGPVWQKTATIGSDRTRLLHTSPERAAAINAMLKGTANYLAPGDTLMAFGSIPMVNYLTRTCPHIGCSWPELLSPSMLSDKLNASPARPLILRQKFSTIGEVWGAPSEARLRSYDMHNAYMNDKKLDIINHFIAENDYRPIYSDRYFTLLAPPAWIAAHRGR